jgi:hypothetical protein
MALWKAGPELDLAVHERVFQLGANDEVHPYSTDEVWAVVVVKKMRNRGWSFFSGRTDDPTGVRYTARFERETGTVGGVRHPGDATESSSRALAICLAAIRAFESG